MNTQTRFLARTFCIVVFAALGFGARQAVADSTPMVEGDYCDPSYYPDYAACMDVCIATHGQGTQARCSSFDEYGIYHGYPTCQCIR